MTWLCDLLLALVPTHCLICDETAGDHPHFVRLCRVCGADLPARVWPLAQTVPFVDCVWTLGRYDGPLGEMVRAVKYGEHPGLGGELAAHLARAADPILPAIDAITWAPSTAQRHRTRGFHLAAQLGRSLENVRSRPAQPVFELDNGPALASLPHGARRAALRHRLHLAPFDTLPPAIGRNAVLLVDDVITTGTTLAACAEHLKAHGVPTVYALTFASAQR